MAQKERTAYPDYVEFALGMIRFYVTDNDIEFFVECWTERWGGIDLSTFVRVLKEGQGEDRLLAIFVLGYTKEAWTHKFLLPFLHSSLSAERWASALVLGEA